MSETFPQYTSQFPPRRPEMRIKGDGVSSNVSRHRKVLPDSRHDPEADHRKQARGEWLIERVKGEPVKIIAKKTGNTVVAIKKIREGKNRISFDALLEWAHNDRRFAEELAALIGIAITTDPWTAAGAARTETYQPATWTAEERGDECELGQEAFMWGRP